MSMKEIDEIKSQIGDLRRRLGVAKLRLNDARLRHMGLKVGDRIMAKVARDREIECEVVGADNLLDDTPEAVVVKRDGSAGKNSAGFIKSWRKIEGETRHE